MTESTCFAIVPAAGGGARFGGDVPKQYLKIHERFVIDYVLATLTAQPQVQRIIVALNPEDTHWSQSPFAQHEKIATVMGGHTRMQSVQNALDTCDGDADDWVLVHDAARPVLQAQDIDRLFQCLADHPIGGLLGIPVVDTLKSVDAQGQVIETPSREGLWQAQTPQLFRFDVLRRGLTYCQDQGITATDEASVVQALGEYPLMVAGTTHNIKLTRPQDLRLLTLLLGEAPCIA